MIGTRHRERGEGAFAAARGHTRRLKKLESGNGVGGGGGRFNRKTGHPRGSLRVFESDATRLTEYLGCTHGGSSRDAPTAE